MYGWPSPRHARCDPKGVVAPAAFAPVEALIAGITTSHPIQTGGPTLNGRAGPLPPSEVGWGSSLAGQSRTVEADEAEIPEYYPWEIRTDTIEDRNTRRSRAGDREKKHDQPGESGLERPHTSGGG